VVRRAAMTDTSDPFALLKQFKAKQKRDIARFNAWLEMKAEEADAVGDSSKAQEIRSLMVKPEAEDA